QVQYDVRLAQNITDINDKIYNAAPGHSAELAAEASQWYVEDTHLLGLGRPDHEPKASETIPEIVELIGELIDRGLAYPAGGDVYFRVAAFPEYGRLSGRQGDEESLHNPSEESERTELKEDPRDFALWKAHKEGEDTVWESPWGPGRPGWHIECSAMAEKFLGPVFEIHGGGIDLIFPHHENELAQSRGAGNEFARMWMHNGLLELTGEKMSKSLGNIVSLRDALEKWGRETILLFFMTAQWRKPIDFSDELMSQAAAQAETFRNYFVGLEYEPEDLERDELGRVLDDDFNTPEALALFHDWRGRGRTASLRWGLELFGLGSLAETVAAPAEIVALAEQRKEARASGDFEEADRLRVEIEAKGWEVRDVAEGFELVPK
ncbi:MAG: cysteine--tRNA ligase, partial [Actinomycetota bacterium]|nr:cysteine--tRNA ligase [Actinomycetota bacterium]